MEQKLLEALRTYRETKAAYESAGRAFMQAESELVSRLKDCGYSNKPSTIDEIIKKAREGQS